MNALLSGRWSWRTETDSVLRAMNRALGPESAEMRRAGLEESSGEEARLESTTRYGGTYLLDEDLAFLKLNWIGFGVSDAIFRRNWGIRNALVREFW